MLLFPISATSRFHLKLYKKARICRLYFVQFNNYCIIESETVDAQLYTSVMLGSEAGRNRPRTKI